MPGADQDGSQHGSPHLPMAVGVLGLPSMSTLDERLSARLDLSLLAYKLGYFVLDIVEIPPRGAARSYAWIEELARRADADALVVVGPVDRARLEAVAERRRLVVCVGRPEA